MLVNLAGTAQTRVYNDLFPTIPQRSPRLPVTVLIMWSIRKSLSFLSRAIQLNLFPNSRYHSIVRKFSVKEQKGERISHRSWISVMGTWLKITHPISPVLWVQLYKMVSKFSGKFTNIAIHRWLEMPSSKQKGPLKTVETAGLAFPPYIPYSLLYYNFSNPFLA